MLNIDTATKLGIVIPKDMYKLLEVVHTVDTTVR
jgi:hypothetical protein